MGSTPQQKLRYPAKTSNHPQSPYCMGILACALFLFSPAPLYAAGLTQTHPLDFGTVTITDFSSVGTLVLQPDGNYIASPEIVVVEPPTPATFEATGFAPNTAGTIDVTDGTATEGGNGTGQTFTFTNYINNPATVLTDGAGDFTFDLGATMSTEGDGNAYVSGIYSGTITVTVTF